MVARSRGLNLTSKDMEASRLVFVFVKDSKPRRKVAIPVPDSHTWEQFLGQVTSKLKLTGVSDIYFSSTGVKVTDVSQLQDIDELCVVEGAPAPISNGRSASQQLSGDRTTPLPGDGVMSPTSSLQQRQQSLPQHKVGVSTDGLLSPSPSYGDEEHHKYARRAHPLRRTLQRLLPGIFAPGLPVTQRDAMEASADGAVLGSKPSRRRRYRRSAYNVRNLLLVLFTMACVAMMLYLFIWVSSSPAMSSMGPAGAAAGADTPQQQQQQQQQQRQQPQHQQADSVAASIQAAAAAGRAAGLQGGGGGGVQHPDAAAAGAVPAATRVQQPVNVAGAVTGAGRQQPDSSKAAAYAQQAAISAAEAAGRAAAAAAGAVH